MLLSVPILVTGQDTAKKEFQEETRTLVVNAHGALITLTVPITPGQKVTLLNRVTRQSQDCRVVHVGTLQGGKTQMGVEFVKPTPSFWQIDFPPADWVVPEN
ncbi:MAG TPA: hypothetical protein VMJ93_02075 [Verrucomicrobiae bacterium]|nr:hypothetical protein [Verrucomicrobiae bacterium]